MYWFEMWLIQSDFIKLVIKEQISTNLFIKK